MGAEKDTENFYTVVDTRYDRLSLMKAIATQNLRPECKKPAAYNIPKPIEVDCYLCRSMVVPV
eukprot:1377373-Amorphochlora_amoeboformis.AAC.1